MSTYFLAKAHQDRLLREAKKDQLIKAARRAKQVGSKRAPSRTTGWTGRLHITRA
jgi:hypothetical protein